MVVRTPKETLEEKMDAVIDDPVNHPSHYTDGIETIDYIESKHFPYHKLMLEGKIIHGGNPVLRWMAGNVVAEIDAAENIKPSKKKSTEKIDGIVALIMGLDRAIRHEQQGSVYDDPEHGLWVF